MIELISKTAAINTTFNMCCRWDGEDRDDLRNMMLTAFQELPTIDPVKHGKWIKDGEANVLYKCSACNDLCTVAGWANCIPKEQMYKMFKFCPNCGAKMERSEE